MQKNKTLNPDDGHAQDPGGAADEDIVRKIAAKIRAMRIDRNLTVQQLAERASVTKGLLSKIENSRTIPSLPVFVKILRSLGVAFQDFFKDMETPEKRPYVLIKQRGTAPVVNGRASGAVFDASKIQVSFAKVGPGGSKAIQVLPGHRLIYVIAGAAEYRVHNSVIPLQPGDSLYFDGRVPFLLLSAAAEEASMVVIDFADQAAGMS